MQSEVSTGAFYGLASAYEFLGGIGVFASASSRALNMQAQAFASQSAVMTAHCGALSDCLMTISMLADGTTSAQGRAATTNPAVFGTSQAGYNFNWTLSGGAVNLAGGATVDERSLDDGRHTLDITGNPFSTVHTIRVHEGDQLRLFMQGAAGAFTDNNGDGGASAVADFAHTLRWGGVQGVTDLLGASIDLSQVQLLGDDGFNYVQAAGPNPFTSGHSVPVPASGALVLAGLGLLHRQRRGR
ncbi:MAG: hypothetical protein IPP44_24260 [Ideonella sp.]|nr:hypothetical protein [Ideonella sp.]